MRDPMTLGPVYRTTDTYDALDAWEADDMQWLFTDDVTYLVGYAPAIFRDAPMAYGFRMTSPEELRRHLVA